MGRKTLEKSGSTEAYEKLYEAVRAKGNADAAKNIKASLDDWRGLQDLLGQRETSVKQIAKKWKMLQKSNARALEDLVSLIRLEKEKIGSDDSDSSSEETSENAESSSKSNSKSDSESSSTSSDIEKTRGKAEAAATQTSSGRTATSKSAVKTKAQARSDSSSSSSDSDSSSDPDAEVKMPQSLPERTKKRKRPVSSSSSSSSPTSSSSSSPTSSSSSSPTSSSSSSSTSSSSSSSDSSDSSKSEKSSASDSSSESSSESDSKEFAPPAKRRKTETNGCLEKATSSTESKAKDSTIEKMADVGAEQNTPSTPTTISAEESATPLVTSTPNAAVNGKKQKQPRKSNTPFQRIKVDHVQFTDDRLKDNSFQSRRAKAGDYGEKASADLIKTRGDGFRKEKNKKKRGSYRGGEITLESHSIKFD